LNANIRRIEARIRELSSRDAAASLELAGDGWRCFEDRDENRLVFDFDGKPSEAIRDRLKRSGWRWAPSRGQWVRQLTAAARYDAKKVADDLPASAIGA
jgi:hypothetical protein